MRADPDQPNPAIIFNPSVGEYDVEADVGPAYGTQREEAANAFATIMQQNPAAFSDRRRLLGAELRLPGRRRARGQAQARAAAAISIRRRSAGGAGASRRRRRCSSTRSSCSARPTAEIAALKQQLAAAEAAAHGQIRQHRHRRLQGRDRPAQGRGHDRPAQPADHRAQNGRGHAQHRPRADAAPARGHPGHPGGPHGPARARRRRGWWKRRRRAAGTGSSARPSPGNGVMSDDESTSCGTR